MSSLEETKDGASKSKFNLPDNNVSTSTASSSSTNAPNTDTDHASQAFPVAAFSIETTSFKRRKKKSKTKQMLAPRIKRKLDDENDDHDMQRASTLIKESQKQSVNKRRKLNAQFSSESTTKPPIQDANSNADNNDVDAHSSSSVVHSHFSDRSVLPSGLDGQGAAVDVYREEEGKKAFGADQPSVTASGHIRYKGRESQRDTRSAADKTKPVSKAPKFLGIGPQRAPDNVLITCRFDFQPDVCKDWKETGFCGYGASCKFLHDRGDYKAGWQIERDWQKFMKQKEQQLATGNAPEQQEENWEISDEEEEELDDDGLPFACYICRQHFVDPVMTNCRHYFCSNCAIQQYTKTDACAICGEKTEGSFQSATKLMKKMKQKKSKNKRKHCD